MPAPRTKPGTRLLLATLLLGACASNRPEAPAGAAKPAADASLEDYAPPAPAGVSADLDQFEASLADYEQQLAQNESRLRAMGVRIASAEPADAKESEATVKDDRFAPPPPARAGDAPGATTRDEKPEAKAKTTTKKSAASRPTAGRSEDYTTPSTATPAPSPRPAPSKPNEPMAEEQDANRGRCAELCELATATCELEAKICDLAARHADEPRYGEVCRRADDDCRVASEACTVCSP